MSELSEARAEPVIDADVLGIKTVAQSLGISRATVLRWIRAKKIEGFFRIGHKWLVRKTDFESFINHKVGEQQGE